jgi:adenosylmethionine-8-amino-7-oxononanoate aminotransferase
MSYPKSTSKLIFPYAVNASQPIRNITEYTEFGFVENNNELLDLSLGNCGCFPLGFKRHDIIDRVTEQMKNMSFCSGEFYTTNPAVLELSERLYNMSGGYRSVFSLSGSDAIEGALRVAQLYNGRNKFLGFKKSYHGSTYLSSSVSDATYMTDFFGKDSRCIISDYNLDMITDDLCAVVIETSSWQNGLYNPGKEFWDSLRKECTRKNIVLIVDDIAMCGGKTGSFFGWTGIVEPDIFTMGKALTSGYFPLSATMVGEKVYNVVKETVFCHGFSYSFSLSGIYSTLAYLDVIEKEKLFDNYPKLLSWATATFGRFKDEYELITDYNNHGLVFNLTLLTDKPVDATFERFLYQYGISAGMWNEGGSGLLIIIPLTATAMWFEELEFKLIQALTDYRSILAISDKV